MQRGEEWGATLAMGARQLVVQEALETTRLDALREPWLTPITNIGVLSLAGAEMMTFFAPPLMCSMACVHTYTVPSALVRPLSQENKSESNTILQQHRRLCSVHDSCCLSEDRRRKAGKHALCFFGICLLLIGQSSFFRQRLTLSEVRKTPDDSTT
jgi:hypothetical protein